MNQEHQKNPIRSKYHGDPLYQPLIDDFLGDLPSLYQEIVGSVEKADWLALTGYCHQLKGTAATYGYEDLVSIVSSIEAKSQEAEQQGHDHSSDIKQLMLTMDRVMKRMLTAQTQL